MANEDLFREEALTHLKTKRMGDIVIYLPIRYSLIVAVLSIAMAAFFYLLLTKQYSKTESVTGFLSPVGEFVEITPERESFVKKIYFTQGQAVKVGDPLIHFFYGKSAASGEYYSSILKNSYNTELTLIDELIVQTKLSIDNEKKLLNDQKKKLINNLDPAQQSLAVLVEIYDLKVKQKKQMSRLVRNGLVAKVQDNDLAIDNLNVKSQKINSMQALQGLKDDIAIKDGEIELLNQRESNELKQLLLRREQITQQKVQLSNSDGYVVSSPINGFVTSVFVTEGTQVSPGKTTLIIQSNKDDLVAKLSIPSRAIGRLKVGQKAKLYYDAFPYQRFGFYQGTVSRISKNVIQKGDQKLNSEKTGLSYLVEIKPENNSIEFNGEHFKLIPGMELTSDIAIEELTFMDMMMSPLKSITKKL